MGSLMLSEELAIMPLFAVAKIHSINKKKVTLHSSLIFYVKNS